MLKFELISSASKDESNGIEKVKLQMMNTCLTSQNCNRTCTNPVFQKSLWKKTAQNPKKTLVGLKILSGVLVVNTN